MAAKKQSRTRLTVEDLSDSQAVKQFLEDVTTHRDYVDLRILRDLLEEYLLLRRVYLNPDGVTLKENIYPKLVEALDIDRSINVSIIRNLAKSMGAHVIARKDALLAEIIEYVEENRLLL